MSRRYVALGVGSFIALIALMILTANDNPTFGERIESSFQEPAEGL